MRQRGPLDGCERHILGLTQALLAVLADGKLIKLLGCRKACVLLTVTGSSSGQGVGAAWRRALGERRLQRRYLIILYLAAPTLCFVKVPTVLLAAPGLRLLLHVGVQSSMCDGYM